MTEALAFVVALTACWFCGVLQGKQWGRESVADDDAIAWRADIVERAKHGTPSDSPEWSEQLGTASVLQDFLERREAA